MPNLAIELDPKSWGEFYGQELAIGRLRKFLSENNLPYATLIPGPSGVGKTTAVRLYLKALFCENRQAGEDSACGECTSCQLDPRLRGIDNNVLWVQSGQDEGLAAQFNRVFEEAYQPPMGFDEEHRNYKIIVIDELQSVPKDKLQRLLYLPEVKDIMNRNKVRFIFITMNESTIDSKIYKPLVGRCAYIPFRPFSEKEVYDFLRSRYENYPTQSLHIIAHASDGSIRQALSYIDDCLGYTDTLEPIVVAEVLNYATDEMRLTIWKMLENYEYKKLQEFWEDNCGYIHSDRLIQQMLRDLDGVLYKENKPSLEILMAKDILYTFLIGRLKMNPLDCLRMLMGKKLISKTTKEEWESSGYEYLFS